eukprot:CAMPEP_0179147870 /NCGR_PEP_ID=MMETSP0796-20121207/71512_1 /TAXON_ID=73915 /ORGANISM="Pyrodinium bahamense, Strain pbaha01" /LENGTH=80 /DNA_ID=CAMNT_0020848513 /DNA_START=566 /DNA_END=806 /DNA_ORIENTATION=+
MSVAGIAPVALVRVLAPAQELVRGHVLPQDLSQRQRRLLGVERVVVIRQHVAGSEGRFELEPRAAAGTAAPPGAAAAAAA